jgi:hypothetical protein
MRKEAERSKEKDQSRKVKSRPKGKLKPERLKESNTGKLNRTHRTFNFIL